MTAFRPVSLPVDVTDAEQFPEFAAAREHARSQRLKATVEALLERTNNG